mgnify:CR=1 FL=1
MKQEIITVFGKRYKAVAKFSNKEADMIEIEPLSEIDELKVKIESLENKIESLENVITSLIDSLNNERERNKLYDSDSELYKNIDSKNI